MKTPDRIVTIAIATAAAVLVTVAGFALGSGPEVPRDTDLPTITTTVDPSATAPAAPAGPDPGTLPPSVYTDDDEDDGRETVTHPVRIDRPDDDDDADDDGDSDDGDSDDDDDDSDDDDSDDDDDDHPDDDDDEDDDLRVREEDD